MTISKSQINNIVKKCQKHGNLILAQVIIDKRNPEKIYYRCKLCYAEIKHNNYLKNRERLLEKQRKYRKLYPEKAAACKKRYREKYGEIYKERQRAIALTPEYKAMRRKWYRKKIEAVDDLYIKKVLCNRSPMTHADITQPMIELKRALILIKRQLRQTEILNRR